MAVSARVGLLVGGTLLFWLVAWGVGALLNLGPADVLLPQTATAMALCLVPAVGTLVLADRAARTQPETVGIAFLAGTIVRMGVVTVAAVLLSQQTELFRGRDWLAWVVVFYLFVLALETALVVAGRASSGKTPAA